MHWCIINISFQEIVFLYRAISQSIVKRAVSSLSDCGGESLWNCIQPKVARNTDKFQEIAFWFSAWQQLGAVLFMRKGPWLKSRVILHRNLSLHNRQFLWDTWSFPVTALHAKYFHLYTYVGHERELERKRPTNSVFKPCGIWFGLWHVYIESTLMSRHQ